MKPGKLQDCSLGYQIQMIVALQQGCSQHLSIRSIHHQMSTFQQGLNHPGWHAEYRPAKDHGGIVSAFKTGSTVRANIGRMTKIRK
jgi:hypothetical protein